MSNNYNKIYRYIVKMKNLNDLISEYYMINWKKIDF